MRKLADKNYATYTFKDGSGLYQLNVPDISDRFNRLEECAGSTVLKLPELRWELRLAFRSVFTSTLKV